MHPEAKANEFLLDLGPKGLNQSVENIKKDLKLIVQQEYLEYDSALEEADLTYFIDSKKKSSAGLLGHNQDVLKELLVLKEKMNSGEALNDKNLADYTAYPFLTIDNDDSKDLDQAMDIEKTQEGYRVLYAIADASYFISPESALDKAASYRVFTTYSPLMNFPILPREISEDLCSLNPNVVRRAFIAIVELDQNGKEISKRFLQGKIKSIRKLSYRGVQDYYEGDYNQVDPRDHSPENLQVVTVLNLLKELGEKLVSNANQKGKIDFNKDEVNASYDEKTNIISFKPTPNRRVERYNEQISVLVNTKVAEYLNQNNLSAIHRYHPAPKKEKVQEQEQQLNKHFATHDSIGTAKSLETVLERYEDESNPNRYEAVSSLLLRVMEKAVYSVDEHLHFGLGNLENYDHFTAPMRRFTDVMDHRILAASVFGQTVIPYQENTDIEYLQKFAQVANLAERREGRINGRSNDYMHALAIKSWLLEPGNSQKWLKGEVVRIDRNRKVMMVRTPEFPFTITIRGSQLPSMKKYSKGKQGKNEPFTIKDLVLVNPAHYAKVTLEDELQFRIVKSSPEVIISGDRSRNSQETSLEMELLLDESKSIFTPSDKDTSTGTHSKPMKKARRAKHQ